MNTLKFWIKRYGWSKEKRDEGASLNNKNAVGNKGGAPPEGNLNSIKHGAYQSIYFDMFNTEDRISWINACMNQLRRLIEAKAKIAGDTEKLQLEKERFDFQRYKADIELKLKKEKLESEKNKNNDLNKDKPIEILIKRKDEDK